MALEPAPRRRGRPPGLDLRPGAARQARNEAGLSLAKVAEGRVSRTAIHLIETGKARPSMATLRLIAERTGRPLDFFLSRPSTMEPRSSAGTVQVERLLATGDPEAAVAAGRALLDQDPDPATGARIRYLMANGHLRLAQAAEARRHAAAARDYFERTGDVLMTAECLGSEAQAAYLVQDGAARQLAELGLALCRSLEAVPQMTESRLLAVLAGVHATDQDWPAAIECYQQAIAAGEVVQDLRRLSVMYSGLSLALQEVGRLDQAAQYAQRALTIHETLNDKVSLARAQNHLGLVLLKQGDLDQAQKHLLISLGLFEETGVETGRANVLLSLCELAHSRDEILEAVELAQRAAGFADKSAEVLTVAESHMWLGRLAGEGGDHDGADREFQRALILLEGAGAAERLSRCHFEYAETLERRGDFAAANKHLKLAFNGRTTSPARQKQESGVAG